MLVQSTTRRFSISALVIAIAMVASISMSAVSPAMGETAGQASTRNIVLGAVAALTAVILYNNYQHKKAAANANTVVGRTANGGIVYGNGRVVYPNGNVYYPSNDGRTACAYDGEGPRCDQNPRLYAWHPRGHAYGWDKNKHHHSDKGNGDDENDQGGDH
jgi:hypothetical protein